MPISPEVFNMEDSLANFQGDLELLGEAIGIYFAESPAMLAAVCDAAGGGDLAGAARAAHRLRGSLVLFSAGLATAAARRVEERARDGDSAGAQAACADLRARVADLDRALQETREGLPGPA